MIYFLKKNESKKEYYIHRIIHCSEISYELASVSRLHNYLWQGLDLHIINRYSDFISKSKKVHFDPLLKIELKEIAYILAEIFNKDKNAVHNELNKQFKNYGKVDITDEYQNSISFFKSIEYIGQEDKINYELAENLVNEIKDEYSNKWDRILDLVINDIKKRTSKFINSD